MNAQHTALFRAQAAAIVCRKCGKRLPDPASRYGPALAPLCWECYSRQRFDDEDDEPRGRAWPSSKWMTWGST